MKQLRPFMLAYSGVYPVVATLPSVLNLRGWFGTASTGNEDQFFTDFGVTWDEEYPTDSLQLKCVTIKCVSKKQGGKLGLKV